MRKLLFFSALLLFANLILAQTTEQQSILPPPYLNNIRNFFGNSIAIDGDYAVIGAPGYLNAKGAAFVYKFDGTAWQYEATLTLDLNVTNYEFGHDVDIQGNTIVVAAPSAYASVGAVYVFEKQPTQSWAEATQVARLTPSDNVHGQYFGTSVKIHDTLILVGSSGRGSSLNPIYVFVKPSSGWTNTTETYRITPSDYNHIEALFGECMDVDQNLLVVGAPNYWYADSANTGAVYIFDLNQMTDTSVHQMAKILLNDTAAFAHFGTDVAIQNDTLIVGAPGKNISGRAFVYILDQSDWTNINQVAELSVNTTSSINLGYSVAIQGDVAFAGANYYLGQQGAVYVFDAAGNWTDMNPTAILTMSDGMYGSQLGSAIAVDGDKLLVGAHKRDDMISKEGAVFYFAGSSNTWQTATETQKITAPPKYDNSYDKTGYSVAIDGNYAVVGAPGYKDSRGCAYVLKYNGSNWNIIARLISTDSNFAGKFGTAVAINNNLIVVSAPRDFKAFVYEKPQSGDWTDATESAVLQPGNLSLAGNFGTSISIYGDTIAIGDDQSDNYGDVYIFEKPGSGWSGTITETYRVAGRNYAYSYAHFGTDVILTENTLIVGAPQDNLTPYKSGSVYVFTKTSQESWSNLTLRAKILADSAQPNFDFGHAIAFDDSILAISAINANNYNGLVYLYHVPGSGWINDTARFKILPPESHIYVFFGQDLSLNQNNLLVGSRFSYQYYGAAYLYQKPADSPYTAFELKDTLIASDRRIQSHFGNAVAIDSNKIIIGAYGQYGNAPLSGEIYAFYTNVPHSITGLRQIPDYAQIYPNPAKNYIFVKNTANAQFTIFSIDGKTMASGRFTGKIDISGLKPGMYVLKIRSKNTALTAKFIKL